MLKSGFAPWYVRLNHLFQVSVVLNYLVSVTVVMGGPYHSHLGWKGPLESIWSNPPAQAGTARAGCQCLPSEKVSVTT